MADAATSKWAENASRPGYFAPTPTEQRCAAMQHNGPLGPYKRPRTYL